MNIVINHLFYWEIIVSNAVIEHDRLYMYNVYDIMFDNIDEENFIYLIFIKHVD